MENQRTQDGPAPHSVTGNAVTRCAGGLSVSCVIPTFNRRSQLALALDSVICQTTPLHEIIIVDDGSTDGTAEMLQEFARLHEDFPVVVIRQENSGPAVARNTAIEAASGDLIAFLDDDDIWLPEKTERQLAALETSPEVCLLGCAADTLVPAGGAHFVDINEWRMLVRNWFLTPGVIARRSVLIDCGGFPARMQHCEDYALWLKIASRYRCALLNEVLVICGHGKPSFGYSGLSADLDALHVGELEALAEWRKECDSGPGMAFLARGLAELRHLRRKFMCRFLKGPA